MDEQMGREGKGTVGGGGVGGFTWNGHECPEGGGHLITGLDTFEGLQKR